MPNLTWRMAASSPSSIRSPLPRSPHSAIICGQTGCGKTVFALDLLEGPYRGVFHHIVILCPTIRHNTTYQGRPWIWGDPEIYIYCRPGRTPARLAPLLVPPFQGRADPFHHRRLQRLAGDDEKERHPIGVGLLRPPRPAIRLGAVSAIQFGPQRLA